MKIAYVTTEYPTENIGGGQSRYLENVTQIMTDHGHEIYVFVKSDKNEVITWHNSITVVRVNCRFDNRLIKRVFSRYEISFCLNREVDEYHRSIGFDVIQYSNLRGIPLCLNRRNPSVIRLSDFAPLCNMAFKEDFCPDDLVIEHDEAQKLNALKKAKKIFGPSKICADLTSEYINREIEVIESPVSVCNDLKKPNDFDDHLKGRKYYLFFGTLNFLKGLHVVCAAADLFLDTHPDSCIVFLGANARLVSRNGAYDSYSYIDKTVNNHDRIIVLPAIGNKEQLNYYIANAEACLMPSRIDNLPNTCIEAMSLGRIVIGTRKASYEQLIEDGVNGFLIERDSPEQLLNAMNRVHSLSDTEKEAIGENAKHITERMRPELIYKKLIALYSEISNSGKTERL